ncbi:diguanylate cyclase domain-containing protein [Brachyspira pilosicoli]|uniref:GGDEF domain-containing response regulator n=1 Tax=Brachyspira pilosicoli TaxID=52584 RepID=UPI001CA51016|nr:diguanylate cyclase [Brachyspira pilosicoli]MBW5397433.1 diguanylate cyclase [Brachyspira pilosicoli]
MNENILVIEHRAELLEKIVDILKERHYNPISTKSRSQAINISNETSLDLIIIDADIGDSQGLQLLDTFKNQENTKGIPVILLSTPYKKIEFIEEAISLDIDGLVFTPFDEMEFIVNVHNAMKEKKMYIEHQKTLKQIDYLQNALNNMTETSNKNYQSYKDSQKKYEEILNIDLETGFYNKKEFLIQFKRLLAETVRHEETIILASFSIDGIDDIIEEFGIMAGEEIILQFSKVLINATREEDIIARYDTNLFMVAFKRMDIRLYEDKIEQIKELVNKNEIMYNEIVIKYTVSAGIAYTAYKANYHFDNLDKEIAPSLLALHNAKRRGFAKVYIHPTVIRR